MPLNYIISKSKAQYRAKEKAAGKPAAVWVGLVKLSAYSSSIGNWSIRPIA